jgi:RNA polymerase sigma factor (sigma-70 family)
MTDQAIIQHLQSNQYSLALKGLYHVLPHAKKFIIANHGDTHDAEDVFQDALVILCKKVQSGDFQLTASLKTYLLAIVRNRWHEVLRSRKKLPLADNTEPGAIHFSIDEEPRYAQASAAFQLLGEKCRELLLMFYFRRKSYSEIAELLSFANEQTAKNQKYRCLQKAKEHYLNLIKE